MLAQRRPSDHPGRQIAVLPVLLANFGQVSPVSLLANLVVLPAFPPAMVLAALLPFWVLYGRPWVWCRLAGLGAPGLDHTLGGGFAVLPWPPCRWAYALLGYLGLLWDSGAPVCPARAGGHPSPGPATHTGPGLPGVPRAIPPGGWPSWQAR